MTEKNEGKLTRLIRLNSIFIIRTFFLCDTANPQNHDFQISNKNRHTVSFVHTVRTLVVHISHIKNKNREREREESRSKKERERKEERERERERKREKGREREGERERERERDIRQL